MNFDLRPSTEPRKRMAELSERHAADFAVRAGPLLQPWGRNQAVEIIGKVALGLDPNEG